MHSNEVITVMDNKDKACQDCAHSDHHSTTQFFASGPFYAMDSSVDTIDSQVDNKEDNGLVSEKRSDHCSVLYAEMPDDTHPTTAAAEEQLITKTDYQFVCYNCCSQLNDNLYYISRDKSKSWSEVSIGDPIGGPMGGPIGSSIGGHINNRSGLSKSAKDESSYTTVIKPKAVRPKVTLETNQSDVRPTRPTLSLDGSTHVLTDKDDSAFTQICRRRSNSEATHHYQSISYDKALPSRTGVDYNRPLRHQRSKSVNKTYNNNWDQSLAFSECEAISDKHLAQKQTNIYCNNCDERYCSEPIHMTLEEVKSIFKNADTNQLTTNNGLDLDEHKSSWISNELHDSISCSNAGKCKSKSKIKCAIDSIFKTKRKSSESGLNNLMDKSRTPSPKQCQSVDDNHIKVCPNDSPSPFTHRALPPLPPSFAVNANETNGLKDQMTSQDERQKFLDYAASIERVKDCGWYWGPISGEMAEKLLESEPCGSFIVRDSSDEHYIFSLTFKLNGMVRHVRIEHDQGNFSFGSLQKFKSNTIVDFIENAVQHSRSGRFLFFLHRRPVMGPMRVQLLHPISRFKQIQSLQHMCRFVILKHVRRDLIEDLPLPQMMKCYLNTPYYYSEELASMSHDEPIHTTTNTSD